MIRYQLINRLITKFKYKNYLEIGLDRGATFNNVMCFKKSSVDPAGGEYSHAKPTFRMTSDKFFEEVAPYQDKWDIVFIDGLHEYEQVKKDIYNSLMFLKRGGSIVLHDCSPPTKESQIVPRETRLWCGDVWKAVVEFRATQEYFGLVTIDDDLGLGWIHHSLPKKPFSNFELTWESLEKNRKEYLGLITSEEFYELCK